MPASCGTSPLLTSDDEKPTSNINTNNYASHAENHTQIKDDIVISGIGGRYPDCDDIEEFWDKLVNGVELSSVDDRRWPVGEYMYLIASMCKIWPFCLIFVNSLKVIYHFQREVARFAISANVTTSSST